MSSQKMQKTIKGVMRNSIVPVLLLLLLLLLLFIIRTRICSNQWTRLIFLVGRDSFGIIDIWQKNSE